MKSIVILMMEEEQPEGLSARKLVVETAKHNVLTAYNAKNGLELLHKFPKVDAVLVHESILAKNPELLAQVRAISPTSSIIVAAPLGNTSCPDATHIVDSHRPHALLQLLAQLFNISTRNG